MPWEIEGGDKEQHQADPQDSSEAWKQEEKTKTKGERGRTKRKKNEVCAIESNPLIVVRGPGDIS